MKVNRPVDLKRLSIEIESCDLQKIKMNALEQNKTIRVWVMEALIDKIAKDKDLGF